MFFTFLYRLIFFCNFFIVFPYFGKVQSAFTKMNQEETMIFDIIYGQRKTQKHSHEVYELKTYYEASKKKKELKVNCYQ